MLKRCIFKRITFEHSEITEKGHPLDGHDFIMIDLNHYILSGYIKNTVNNVPCIAQSSVVYSYLQEVQNGAVIWDWKSIDYPELYALSVTDADTNANDFANTFSVSPDYVHFNSMLKIRDLTKPKKTKSMTLMKLSILLRKMPKKYKVKTTEYAFNQIIGIKNILKIS